MLVFKFGGASVKDAKAVKNVARILNEYANQDLLIVVSAMGKTTNAFEKLVNAYFHNPSLSNEILKEIKVYHEEIMLELFPNPNSKVWEEVNNFFVEAEWMLEEEMNHGYNHTYDQLVSLGELLSTTVIAHYLNENKFPLQWLDAREFILTDNTYREAKIDWQSSARAFGETMSKVPRFNGKLRGITQGFIGCTSENFTTTLGREGSDYSAAIIAFLSDATEVSIWKDVQGVLSADPRKFKDAVLIPHMSYHDAVELTYYGATIIHPKTIKPLQNKQIPLRVRSFEDSLAPGTLIDNHIQDNHCPCIIHKGEQILISLSVKDFSFIAEEHLSSIFKIFSEHGVKLNLMQLSALSFSVCIDGEQQKMNAVVEVLKDEFRVLFNTGVELFTIRYYNVESIRKLSEGRKIILEQRSRQTIQLVALAAPLD
jgi:aspartate kinase